MGAVDDFFNTLQMYNESFVPMVVITFILGAVSVFLAFRKKKYSDKFTAAILSFLWVWSGLIFFVLFFGSVEVVVFGFVLSNMWYLLGILFVTQGCLILFFGVVKSALSFRFVWDRRCFVGVGLIVYAVLVYPFIGFLTGFSYPRYPVFGIAPCPLTIFTFGLLQWSDMKTPILVTIIPLIHAILGIMPVLVYSILADVGLVFSGVIGFPLILMQNRKLS